MRKTIGKDLPDGTYLEIEAEERHDGPTAYFSITASGWEKHGTWSGRACARNKRDLDFGGMCHDEILRAAPQLEPLVTVHLSDSNGTPMHAEVNGWYFYSGEAAEWEREHYGEEYSARLGTDRERAADALHIPVDDLPEGLDRDGFHAFCESLRPRWAKQAQTARAALAAMHDGDGVEE